MLNNTIIIPVWNEEKIIKLSIEEVLNTEVLTDGRIIVVDDGSTDETAEILKEIAEENKRLFIIYNKHGGKDFALWAGINFAETEWIGIMDGDMQNVPEDFEYLFRKIEDEKADAIWGIRTNRKDTWVRQMASFFGGSIKKCLLKNCVVQDCGCGIFVARRNFLAEIVKVCPKPYGQLHCHFPELIEAQGGKVIEMEVQHRNRKSGKEKFGVFNRIIPGFVSLIQASKIKRKLQPIHKD